MATASEGQIGMGCIFFVIFFRLTDSVRRT
jgi:hypothetical protein